MTTLNPNSEKAKRWRQAYVKARYSYLEQVYRTYSFEKGMAYRNCLKLMRAESGQGFRIISWNTTHFTVGWKTFEGIRIETKSNSYLIPW